MSTITISHLASDLNLPVWQVKLLSGTSLSADSDQSIPYQVVAEITRLSNNGQRRLTIQELVQHCHLAGQSAFKTGILLAISDETVKKWANISPDQDGLTTFLNPQQAAQVLRQFVIYLNC